MILDRCSQRIIFGKKNFQMKGKQMLNSHVDQQVSNDVAYSVTDQSDK